MRRLTPRSVLLALAVLVVACTDDEQPELGTAEVRSAEVIETVAAPARLEPADRATVSAQVGGEVVDVLVDDGDAVRTGDELVVLSSESLEEQVEQAAAAVDAARSVGETSQGAGVDLAPVIAPFRTQFDTVLPDLVGVLETQVEAADAALEAAVLAVTGTGDRAGALQAEVTEALEKLDVLDVADELELDGLPDGPDTSAALDTLTEAQATTEQAREQLAATQDAFFVASEELAAAERSLASQAAATESAQAEAVAAQVGQAEQALERSRARLDDLVVTAPIDGVVELARGEAGTGVPDLEDLDGLGDLGGAGGLLEDPAALDGLGGVGSGATSDGPIRAGATVSVGQLLLTVYDVSSFTAAVEVDEIDVVDVAVGQDVEVLVDAFPGEPWRGVVDRVALEPRSDPTGGALYPVTVRLTDLPDDVEPRIGLTAATEIEVARVDGERVVPTSALLRRGEGEVVHVVRDGVAVEVPVILEAIGDAEAAVDGDLDAGETVITTGVETVADGDEVEVDG